jgi:CubicO group peptidase (beta-lactamase class C family)
VASELEALLVRHVEAGTVPGAVALRGGRDTEVVAVGVASIGGKPMHEDAIFRIQSMTKPITAVAALRLVEAGRIGLDQSVETWLPELADRRVLTSPGAPLDDTVPAHRAITLRHLLTMGSGYGMEFGDSPLRKAMAENGTESGPEPVTLGADEWLARLAELPLAFQPGEGRDTTTRSPCSASSWLGSPVGRLKRIWTTICSARSGCRTPPSGFRRRSSTDYLRPTGMARAVSWRRSRPVVGSMPGRRPST